MLDLESGLDLSEVAKFKWWCPSTKADWVVLWTSTLADGFRDYARFSMWRERVRDIRAGGTTWWWWWWWYSLIILTRPHSMLLPYWTWHPPTQCLSLIGHGPYPRDAFPSLTTPYINTILFSGIILLILPTAGCICQKHPADSSQVKVIYDIRSLVLPTFIVVIGRREQSNEGPNA